MSEKRFFVKVYSNNEPYFFDEKQEYVEEIYTVEEVRNLHPMAYWQVVDLLNSFVEEKEQLKQSNDRFADTVAKQVSLLIELRKENEQLKKENDKYRVMINANANLNERLAKENEQLRKLLREAEDEIETLKKSNQNLMWSLVKP